MKSLPKLVPLPDMKRAMHTDSRVRQNYPLWGAQLNIKQREVGITYEEAAVALAAHFRPHHMNVGNAHTVGVACVEMPTTLPRFAHRATCRQHWRHKYYRMTRTTTKGLDPLAKLQE